MGSTRYREVRNKLTFVSFTWIQFLLYLLCRYYCFFYCFFLFLLARAAARVVLTLEKANNLLLTFRAANIMEATVWFPALSWFFTALGLVGNSFVILLITSKKQLIHQTTNWFLLSLSFADLGVSLSIIPGEFFCFPSKRCHFVLLASFQWAFLYASVVNLCMLTLDRYIVIVKPFIYVLMMSKSRVVAFICAAWIVPLTFCFIPFAFIYSEHHLTTMRNYTYFMVFALECLPVQAPCKTAIRGTTTPPDSCLQSLLNQTQQSFSVIRTENSLTRGNYLSHSKNTNTLDVLRSTMQEMFYKMHFKNTLN